jgi:ATP adenylyltransferase
MNPGPDRELRPGDLYPALLATTRSALARGALQCIRTEQRVIEDAGVRFLLRSVSSLQHKREDRQRRRDPRGPGFNPFLPPEPELTLGAVSPTHTAVLNKFNVLEHHLLIVTREFRHQETLLDEDDFHALWLALGEIDGLGFYNGGAAAGASQTHKHLQLVPLPLANGLSGLPMEALLGPAEPRDVPRELPTLPFRHAYAALPADLWRHPRRAARLTLGLYRAMLARCGIEALAAPDGERQSAPYNLLLRRGWMLLVPRSREHFQDISVNALGYAGSLFVRNAEEIERVQRQGPMQLLVAVAEAG